MTVLLVTGGRDFCEIRDGADHMGERMALGWVMDWIGPSRVVVGSETTGADRWARIWCERRSVPCVTGERHERAVRFPGGRTDPAPTYEINFPITEKGVAPT